MLDMLIGLAVLLPSPPTLVFSIPDPPPTLSEVVEDLPKYPLFTLLADDVPFNMPPTPPKLAPTPLTLGGGDMDDFAAISTAPPMVVIVEGVSLLILLLVSILSFVSGRFVR